MLVIRLARTGRKKYPTYRIVAAESARPTTGKFVAILGNYNPHTKDLSLNKDEALRYIGNGAQPSNAVIKLLQQEKVELPTWVKLATKNRPPKKEPAEAPAEAAPTEAPAETEASAEPAEEAQIAETAEAEATAAEDQKVNAADDSDEGATPTAASEQAEAEAATEAEDKAAEAATEASEASTEA